MLDGMRGSGKSTLLAQSIAYALDDGWVVISVPRAINLINSSTLYTYNAQHKAYLQPEATKQLLEAVLKVNGSALKQIKTSKAVEVDGSQMEAGTSLEVLLKRGVDEASSAAAKQTVLEAVFEALAAQTERPVLVAVDDAQALFRTSLYKDRTLSTWNRSNWAYLAPFSPSSPRLPPPPPRCIHRSPLYHTHRVRCATRTADRALGKVVLQADDAGHQRIYKLHPQHLETRRPWLRRLRWSIRRSRFRGRRRRRSLPSSRTRGALERGE